MEGTILVGRECSHAVGSLMKPLFSCGLPLPGLGQGRGPPAFWLQAPLCPPWRLGASPESRYSLTLTRCMTLGKLPNVLNNSLKMKLLI